MTGKSYDDVKWTQVDRTDKTWYSYILSNSSSLLGLVYSSTDGIIDVDCEWLDVQSVRKFQTNSSHELIYLNRLSDVLLIDIGEEIIESAGSEFVNQLGTM